MARVSAQTRVGAAGTAFKDTREEVFLKSSAVARPTHRRVQLALRRALLRL